VDHGAGQAAGGVHTGRSGEASHFSEPTLMMPSGRPVPQPGRI